MLKEESTCSGSGREPRRTRRCAPGCSPISWGGAWISPGGSWRCSTAARGCGLRCGRSSATSDWSSAAGHTSGATSSTITVNHLDLPPALARTLATTNPIESAYSVARVVMGKVKRWRDGAMVVRWTAAGMEVAASKFRRIKGYRELPILIEKLDGIADHFSQKSGKVA